MEVGGLYFGVLGQEQNRMTGGPDGVSSQRALGGS